MYKLPVMSIVIYMCFGTIYEKKIKNSKNMVTLPCAFAIAHDKVCFQVGQYGHFA